MFALLALSRSDFPESCRGSTYEGPFDYQNQTFLDKKCIIFTNLTDTKMIRYTKFEQLEWILLPDSLEVSSNTFADQRSLKTVIIPKATKIGMNAFSNCTSLSSIQMPLVEEIKMQAFDSTNLSEIDAPSVQNIDNFAFINTTNLKKIRIPSVRKLKGMQFYQCYGLIDIDISNVESLGLMCFEKCISLKSIYAPKAIVINESPIDMLALEEIIAPNAINVSFGTFKNTNYFKRLIIPKAINVFIEFPDSIEEVDISSVVSLLYDFKNKRNLRSVKIDNIESIPSFANCTSLTKISAPKVRRITSSAFENCKSLVEAFFPRVNNTDFDCFKGCSALKLVVMNPTELWDSMFEGCESIEELILPSVHFLKGDYIFRGMKSLRVLDISGVISASNRVGIFEGCESLQEVRLGCTMPTNFEEEAFKVSAKVVNITLPNDILSSCSNNYLSGCKAINGSLYFKGGYLMPEPPADHTLMYVLIGVGAAVIVAAVATVVTLIMIRKKLPNKIHGDPLL